MHLLELSGVWYLSDSPEKVNTRATISRLSQVSCNLQESRCRILQSCRRQLWRTATNKKNFNKKKTYLSQKSPQFSPKYQIKFSDWPPERPQPHCVGPTISNHTERYPCQTHAWTNHMRFLRLGWVMQVRDDSHGF